MRPQCPQVAIVWPETDEKAARVAGAVWQNIKRKRWNIDCYPSIYGSLPGIDVDYTFIFVSESHPAHGHFSSRVPPNGDTHRWTLVVRPPPQKVSIAERVARRLFGGGADEKDSLGWEEVDDDDDHHHTTIRLLYDVKSYQPVVPLVLEKSFLKHIGPGLEAQRISEKPFIPDIDSTEEKVTWAMLLEMAKTSVQATAGVATGLGVFIKDIGTNVRFKGFKIPSALTLPIAAGVIGAAATQYAMGIVSSVTPARFANMSQEPTYDVRWGNGWSQKAGEGLYWGGTKVKAGDLIRAPRADHEGFRMPGGSAADLELDISLQKYLSQLPITPSIGGGSDLEAEEEDDDMTSSPTIIWVCQSAEKKRPIGSPTPAWTASVAAAPGVYDRAWYIGTASGLRYIVRDPTKEIPSLADIVPRDGSPVVIVRLQSQTSAPTLEVMKQLSRLCGDRGVSLQLRHVAELNERQCIEGVMMDSCAHRWLTGRTITINGTSKTLPAVKLVTTCAEMQDYSPIEALVAGLVISTLPPPTT